MNQPERWQMSGSEPESYELYRVPRQFGPQARRLLENVPLRPGDQVLDVACGTGVVARLAADRVAPSGRVVGIDLNDAMLAVARAHAPDTGALIEWRQGDADALPFSEAAFDAVLCQQGLQFMPDKLGAVREMRRVAVPGGIVALNVSGAPSRYNIALAEALTKHVDATVATRSLAPFSLANPAVLRGILIDAGLRAIDIRTVVLTRRVEPTQEWLLQDSGAMPYSAAIAGLDAVVRAAMIREIAAKLKDLWDVESFAVPTEIHLAYARK